MTIYFCNKVIECSFRAGYTHKPSNINGLGVLYHKTATRPDQLTQLLAQILGDLEKSLARRLLSGRNHDRQATVTTFPNFLK